MYSLIPMPSPERKLSEHEVERLAAESLVTAIQRPTLRTRLALAITAFRFPERALPVDDCAAC